MRVVHAIAPGRLAGAERVVLAGTGALAATGVEVSLAVLGDTRCPEHGQALAAAAEVAAFEVTTHRRVDLAAALRLHRELDRRAPDLVHAHGYKALVYARLATPTRPLVVTHHGATAHDARARFYEGMARSLYRTPAVRHVIAVGEPVRDQLVAAGVPQGKCTTVQNFVATSARGSRCEPGERPRLLALGRLSPEKGLDVLLDAIVGVDAELDVVGDGPERDALLQQAQLLGIADRVHFHGHQTSVEPWLAASDVLVMASHREGLPMALLEAVASGLPVVATRVGATAEVVADGDNGVLVAPGDRGALTAALHELTSELPRYTTAAAHAAERVRSAYSRDAWARQTVAVYDRVLAPRGTRA